jgi:hypothetical protein
MGRHPPISRSAFSVPAEKKDTTPHSIETPVQLTNKKGDAAMFGIAPKEAFRLLRKKRLLYVLQSDSTGVIRKLTDAKVQPFQLKAKKIRRMLAGKQRQALCVSGQNGDGNAFFVRSNELVALDPLDGRYVILSPLLEILNTDHGNRVFQEHPRQAAPIFKSNAPEPAPSAFRRIPPRRSHVPSEASYPRIASEAFTFHSR